VRLDPLRRISVPRRLDEWVSVGSELMDLDLLAATCR
jgi:hypothetical protein